MRQAKDLEIGDELYAPTRQGFYKIKIENIKRVMYNVNLTPYQPVGSFYEAVVIRVNDVYFFELESKVDRNNSIFINYEDMIKNLPIQYYMQQNIKLDEDIEDLLKSKYSNKSIIRKWKNLIYESKINLLKKIDH